MPDNKAENRYTVFVYGTLMKNQVNHHYLKTGRYLCEGTLKGYRLYDTPDDYPAAVKAKGHEIYGEVYEVDEKTKQLMDELEEVGELYDCVKVDVKTDKEEIQALFYEYLRSTEGLSPYKKGKWVCRKQRIDINDRISNGG